MWTCQSCQTKNPKASSFCQTCGERPSLGNGIPKPKTYHSPASSNQETKRQGLEAYYHQAKHRFAESDFSLIAWLGTYAIILSLLTILGGIIFMFMLCSDADYSARLKAAGSYYTIRTVAFNTIPISMRPSSQYSPRILN